MVRLVNRWYGLCKGSVGCCCYMIMVYIALWRDIGHIPLDVLSYPWNRKQHIVCSILPLDFFVLVSALMSDYELHAGGDPPKLEYALHATSHCLGVIHNSLCLTYASIIIKSKSLETLVHSERQTFAACFACTSFRRGPVNAALWPLLEKLWLPDEMNTAFISKQRW